jgi:hypothetical protein
MGGIAYVHIRDLPIIAAAHFKLKLTAELVKASKFFPEIMKDERLQTLLIQLSNPNSIDFNFYEAKAPTDADKIRLSDLDFYSKKSFPPCMK